MKKEYFMVASALLITIASAFLIKPGDITGRAVLEAGSESVACTIVKTPYEEYDTITYQESSQETVNEARDLSYKVLDQRVGEQEGVIFAVLEVLNTDVLSGNFKFSISFFKESETPIHFSIDEILAPQKSFRWVKDSPFSGLVDVSFTVEPEIKTISTTRTITTPVERIVAVQKYRDEEVCN